MKVKLCTALVIIFSLCFFKSNAQVTIYINDVSAKIKGESTDRGYENQIKATSFAQEESNSGSASVGGGGGAGKATMGNFVFSMPINRSLIGLKSALYQGTHITKLEITFVKSGETPFVYYKITLEEVLVVGISDAVCGTCGDRNGNQVQLNAAKATWEYTLQDPKGGSNSKYKFTWDAKTNKGE